MKPEVLWNGRYLLRQSPDVFPLSMDTMALGDFIHLRRGDRVFDLGCGSGALGLLLAGRDLPFSYWGVDCSPAACRLVAENLAANALTGEVILGQLEEVPRRFSPGGWELVISNPPYFPPDQGRVGTDGRTGCTPETLCQAAGHLLREKGRFALVYPAAGLPRLFRALEGNRLTPKRLRLIAHSSEKPPRLALVESRKGGGEGLNVLPNLNLYHPDGTPTEDYRRIYHMNQP